MKFEFDCYYECGWDGHEYHRGEDCVIVVHSETKTMNVKSKNDDQFIVQSISESELTASGPLFRPHPHGSYDKGCLKWGGGDWAGHMRVTMDIEDCEAVIKLLNISSPALTTD